MDNQKMLNKDLVIQSLQRQLSNAHYQIAEQEAVTVEIIDQKTELEKELETYRNKEISEMDGEPAQNE